MPKDAVAFFSSLASEEIQRFEELMLFFRLISEEIQRVEER
jgi:hypothetical protein